MPSRKLVGVTTALVLSLALAACNLAKAPEPTPDVKALYTAAAGTVISRFNDEQTQTAVSISPMPLASFTALPTFALGAGLTPFGTAFTLGTPGAGLTPFGTAFTLGTPGGGLTAPATPLPAGTGAFSFPVGCDDAMLIHETVPDGKSVAGGQVFDKSWDLQNVGTCTWDEGYSFVFVTGDRLQGTDIKIRNEADFTKPGHSQNFIVHLTPPIRAAEYKGYWQMKNDSGGLFGSKVWVDVVVH